MTKDHVNQLINDVNVIKVGIVGVAFMGNRELNLCIHFLFCHAGVPGDHSLPPGKRIEIACSTMDDYIDGVTSRYIENEIIIIANSDNADYALTYHINLNKKERKINVTLEDTPERGERFITEEEKNGIRCAF